LDTCPQCSLKNIDIYRFQLPFELPIPIAMAVSRGIRSDLERLFKNYSAIELHICKNCGYTEIRFIARDTS